MNFLLKNQVFKDKELSQIFRITLPNIKPDFTYITVLPENTEKHTYPIAYQTSSIVEGFHSGKLEILDGTVYDIDPYSLPQKAKAEANKRWELLSPYLMEDISLFLNSQSRSQIISKISKETGHPRPKLYQWVSWYFQRGQSILSLAPGYSRRGVKKQALDEQVDEDCSDLTKIKRKKRGRRGKGHGVGVPGDLFHDQFDFALKHFHFGEKKSIIESYRKMLRVFFPNLPPDEVPSDDQLRYYQNKNFSKMQQFKKRYGKIVTPRNERAVFCSSVHDAGHPGGIFELDATVGNLYLLSSYFDYDDDKNPNNLVIIGRPVIYHIVDTFSRMILGVYVGVVGPSWGGAQLVLRNLLQDKREYCLAYGIDLDKYSNPALGYTGEDLFPLVAGLPEKFRVDNGEFRGQKPEGLVVCLGENVENMKPYCGDLKGTVEQSFNLSQKRGEYTELFTVQQSFKVRDERLGLGTDPRRWACLTMKEFTGLYLQIVLELNASIRHTYPLSKDMVKRKIPAIPVKLWQYGIEYLGGTLRKPPLQKVKLALLPRKACRTTREGIRFYKDQMYSCDFALRNGWFEKGNYQDVTLAYNPDDMNEVYLVHSERGTVDYIPCQLTPRCKELYSDTGQMDIEYLNRYKEEESFNIEYEQNQKSLVGDNIRETLKKAKKRLPKGGNKPKSWQGTQENRALEKEREKAEHREKRKTERKQAKSENTRHVAVEEDLPETPAPSSKAQVLPVGKPKQPVEKNPTAQADSQIEREADSIEDLCASLIAESMGNE